MSDYTNALQTLSEGATKSTTPTATTVTGQQDWMDAYGQQDQKSWGDYYKKYKDQFSGDQATGYAAATQASNNNNNVGLQYLMNTQQRQIDGRMNEYQDWMKNHWEQQQQGQQQLFDYLKQLGGGADQPGDWWQGQRFQDMAGMYAQHNPEWVSWAQGQDQTQFRTAIADTLQGFYNMTPEERDAVGAQYGISGQQWLQDLMYLNNLLEVGYKHEQPGEPTPPPPPPPDPNDWRQSEDYRRIAGYASQVDTDNWAADGWQSGEAAKRQAIKDSMDVISRSTPRQLETLVRSWGVSGLTGQQWKDDVMYLAQQLGVQ